MGDIPSDEPTHEPLQANWEMEGKKITNEEWGEKVLHKNL